MSDIKGGQGELRGTFTLTRKATGEKITFTLVGTASEEDAIELGALVKPKEHGTAGAVVGPGTKLTTED